MIFELQEVRRVVRAAGEPGPVKVKGWSVDTRTQQPGDLYFALRGPNFDGHSFVGEAAAKQAAGVVVERPMGAPDELIVGDTLRALQELGAWARERWGGKVVGVTGSAGKTTTKDAIAQLLAVDLPVGKTVGNLNNHVGVPLSILRLPPESDAAVLEIGMNHAGEIRELAGIAKPDIGVVTNVGYAHLEFFDSIDGVAAAKRELIEALPRSGVAVLNADDPRVAKFREAHPGRSVTFGFSEGAEVRATNFDGARFRAAGVEDDDVRRHRAFLHRFDDPVQREGGILGIDLGAGVCIDCGQVILAVDLHSVSGKEEESDVGVGEGCPELLESCIHRLMGAIRLLDDREAARLQLRRNVVGVIHRIVELRDLRVGRVANYKCCESFSHAKGSR